MSGIYVHIPFCKQACSYCDFYFTISYKKRSEIVNSICKDIILKSHIKKFQIKTIYFGGGTPTTLKTEELNKILQTILQNFEVSSDAEITVEANPDDLNFSYLQELKQIGFNRISLGVQSFDDEQLKKMNRRHSSQQAKKSIELAKQFFDNISTDLIFGIPEVNIKDLQYSADVFYNMQIQHLSCYALTYEKGTPLYYKLRKGRVEEISDEEYQKQFYFLHKVLQEKGYEHYEISNYALPTFQSKHNSAYWDHKKYIGVGPSAHSYFSNRRYWNVSGIKSYIDSIKNGKKYFEYEELDTNSIYNETVMLNLRTKKGINLNSIVELGDRYKEYFLKSTEKYLLNDTISKNDNWYKLNIQYWFVADKIISDLMIVE